MNISPTKFAFYLKNSSFNSEEQRVILNLLPTLNSSEVKTLFKQLKSDYLKIKKIIQTIAQKREQIQMNFQQSLQGN